MTTPLSAARCFHHGTREAIGRCKDCHHFFCRECLAEVQGRLTCANCMQSDLQEQPSRKFLGRVWIMVNGLLGSFVLWMVFYFLGRLLLNIPDLFHTNLID